MPPYPPQALFTRRLLEAKAKAHFPSSWAQVLQILDGEVDSSHIKHWEDWNRTKFKLDCIFLSGTDEQQLVEWVRSLREDYRTVVWAAEDKPHEWIAWLNEPRSVSAPR